MKIAEIGKLVRAAKSCVIATSMRGRQWIGTWSALYPVDGVVVGKNSVAALFDLTEKEQADVQVAEIMLEDVGLYPKEKITPNLMHEIGMEIGLYGGLICLTDRGRAYMLEKRKVKPAIGSEGYRRFYLGEGRNGGPVIVIEDGMIWSGVAAPLDRAQTEKILALMRKFAFLQAGGFDAEEEEEMRAEQMEMGAGE